MLTVFSSFFFRRVRRVRRQRGDLHDDGLHRTVPERRGERVQLRHGVLGDQEREDVHDAGQCERQRERERSGGDDYK